MLILRAEVKTVFKDSCKSCHIMCSYDATLKNFSKTLVSLGHHFKTWSVDNASSGLLIEATLQKSL